MQGKIAYAGCTATGYRVSIVCPSKSVKGKASTHNFSLVVSEADKPSLQRLVTMPVEITRKEVKSGGKVLFTRANAVLTLVPSFIDVVAAYWKSVACSH